MTVLIDVLKEITNMTTPELVKNAKKYISSRDDQCAYYININGGIFFDLEISTKIRLLTIGNIGIHYGNNFIHNKDMDLKTEEEFFQFSLLSDVGDLQYDDYVLMVKFQERMISELPYTRGSL